MSCCLERCCGGILISASLKQQGARSAFLFVASTPRGLKSWGEKLMLKKKKKEKVAERIAVGTR